MAWLRGALGGAGLVGALVLCFVPFLPLAVAKLLCPHRGLRRWLTRRMEAMTVVFSWCCEQVLRGLRIAQWDLQTSGQTSPRGTYLLICNHQSWVDILLLLIVFRGRMPFPRFFLKRELLWAPIIGFACWAFDFPFVHRHSRAQIAARPELAGRDAAIARRSCERFADLPVTIVNFVEGTRWTPARHAERQSPYTHLLPPKVGGLTEAFGAMGEQFDAVIDMGIAYHQHGSPGVWRFLRGYPHRIVIDMQLLPVPPQILAAADTAQRRQAVRTWLEARWAAKDAWLAAHSAPGDAADRPL